MRKTVNQFGWLFVLPVVALVAFNAVIPLMTVVNYSFQESFGDNVFFWSGVRWFEQILNSSRFHEALLRQILFTAIVLAHRDPARTCHRIGDAEARSLGVGLPRSDGSALAHSVERGRRHVEHHGAARDRSPRQSDKRPRHNLQLHPPADRCLVHRRS